MCSAAGNLPDTPLWWAPRKTDVHLLVIFSFLFCPFTPWMVRLNFQSPSTGLAQTPATTENMQSVIVFLSSSGSTSQVDTTSFQLCPGGDALHHTALKQHTDVSLTPLPTALYRFLYVNSRVRHTASVMLWYTKRLPYCVLCFAQLHPGVITIRSRASPCTLQMLWVSQHWAWNMKKIDCPIFVLITAAVINFSVVVVSNYCRDQVPTVLLHWSRSWANETQPDMVWNIYPRCTVQAHRGVNI